ncbi:MAG: 16S rRNA (guanine(966)-N(2))-methyltransferase RsmD [Rhodospirillales bacterium]|nr:16S rRNA (guanine(966)-N(2))-methyltransferase RsmD [Rhodospirillales bacterium]
MRIVAGRWRGHTLVAPPGTATRPTSERMRQAIFDRLAHAPWAEGALRDATVLDAFAGSGAMGLEALSRGAAHAWFMETDSAARQALAANIRALRTDYATIIAADATHPPRGAACTLVFLDPPYGKGMIGPALAALRAAGWIGANALLVCETGRDEEPGLGPPIAAAVHGAARVTFLRETAAPNR